MDADTIAKIEAFSSSTDGIVVVYLDLDASISEIKSLEQALTKLDIDNWVILSPGQRIEHLSEEEMRRLGWQRIDKGEADG